MIKATRKRLKTGLIAFALVLSQVLMPVQSAFAVQPAGVGGGPTNNAGDIKVREPGAEDEIPQNDPMLSGCSVVVEFYNFNNTTDLNATVDFAPQAPTGDAVIAVSGASLTPVVVGDGDGDGEGNNDEDGSYEYTLAFTGEPKATGMTTGYKVKVSVDIEGTVGGAKTKVFWMPESCRTLTKTTPAMPTKVDLCETKYDTYTIPATTGVDYYVGDVKTIAGTYSTNGASSVTVKAEAKPGYVLENYSGPWTLTFTNVECEVEPEEVTPAVPTKSDVCGLRKDTFTIPSTEGVDYFVDGENTPTVAGTYSTGGKTSIVVTAQAQDNYVLVGYTGPWTLTFTNEECDDDNVCTVSDNFYVQPWTTDGETYPAKGGSGSYNFVADGLRISTPTNDGYVYGMMTAGETPVEDIDDMSYMTFREATSTGNPQVVTAYILYVDLDGNLATDDGTYLFYEPIYNGTVVTGVWQTWDVDNDDAVFWSFDLTGGNPTLTWSAFVAAYPDAVATHYGFNQGTYNPGTDARIQNLVFDCASTGFGLPGGGGGTPPEEPETPETPRGGGEGSILPAELPLTGNGGSATTWLMLLAALLTYGVVYFAQPRKQFND